MAFLSDDTTPTSPQRIILMGDSGMGKTGSLLSLAEAGYTIHIADLECKAASLMKAIAADAIASKRWTKTQVKDIFSRIEIEEIAEPIDFEKKKSKVPPGVAYGAYGELMGKWGTAYTSPKDVIVTDSLTKLSAYAANTMLRANNREILQVQDYTTIYKRIEEMLTLQTAWDSTLVGQGVQLDCHVILIAHIQYYAIKRKTDNTVIKAGVIGSGDTEVVDTKLYPQTIGDKFSQNVPTWFNTLILYTTATNQPGKRIIKLLASDDAPVKLAAPSFAESKKSLPIETGLADIFKVLTQEI